MGLRLGARARRNKARVGLTGYQRKQDRQRAEKALGRRLRPWECVHHFTLKQLVICPSAAYHRLLHMLEDTDGKWERDTRARRRLWPRANWVNPLTEAQQKENMRIALEMLASAFPPE